MTLEQLLKEPYKARCPIRLQVEQDKGPDSQMWEATPDDRAAQRLGLKLPQGKCVPFVVTLTCESLIWTETVRLHAANSLQAIERAVALFKHRRNIQ